MSDPTEQIISRVVSELAFLTPLKATGVPAPTDGQRAFKVQFSGNCRGELVVLFSSGLAEVIAVNMCGVETVSELQLGEIDEAACEVTNCMAGNLLPTLLGEHNEYSLAKPLAIAPPTEREKFSAIECTEGVIAVMIELEG